MGDDSPSLSKALTVTMLALGASAAPPLQLHPENPHYFLFRDKPTVLIGSGEHYGAVLNLAFDYVRYLDAVAASGLNHTRTFSGVYCEQPGAFNIARNTLAPDANQFITPWARSDTPGYANSGNKFDLAKWDDAYFARLKDFVMQAGRRGVVVELDLFCPFYKDSMWRLSPMNEANNVNAIGKVKRTDVYTLDRSGGLLAIHESLVRKIVTELNECDNLYYEICNEPYFGGVTMAWQERMIDTIAATEKDLRNRHLISLNIANGARKIVSVPAAVSILNFHYASPPDAVAMNYGLGRPIGDNETGFKGTGDTHYRMEAWEFILAGGALYSNLDYSFAVGHEDGTFEYPRSQPGGGNAGFRRQMRVLRTFIDGFDVVRMEPDNSVLHGVAAKGCARALVEPGRQYAVYVFGGTGGALTLDLPSGTYTVRWIDTLTGEISPERSLNHEGGNCVLASPPYKQDIALRVVRTGLHADHPPRARP